MVEDLIPRDGGGRPQRLPNPFARWFTKMNDSGPGADPTRGINCVDCVLSLFDTWLHGRPRVAAPRTFDAYQVRMNVDEKRVLGKLALPSYQGYEIARDVLAQMRQPDTRLWFTASTPHVAVRTETVPGPPGTTRCTIEAATIDPHIPRLATR